MIRSENDRRCCIVLVTEDPRWHYDFPPCIALLGVFSTGVEARELLAGMFGFQNNRRRRCTLHFDPKHIHMMQCLKFLVRISNETTTYLYVIHLYHRT